MCNADGQLKKGKLWLVCAGTGCSGRGEDASKFDVAGRLGRMPEIFSKHLNKHKGSKLSNAIVTEAKACKGVKGTDNGRLVRMLTMGSGLAQQNLPNSPTAEKGAAAAAEKAVAEKAVAEKTVAEKTVAKKVVVEKKAATAEKAEGAAGEEKASHDLTGESTDTKVKLSSTRCIHAALQYPFENTAAAIVISEDQYTQALTPGTCTHQGVLDLLRSRMLEQACSKLEPFGARIESLDSYSFLKLERTAEMPEAARKVMFARLQRKWHLEFCIAPNPERPLRMRHVVPTASLVTIAVVGLGHYSEVRTPPYPIP